MSKPKTAPYLALKTDFRKDDRFEVLGNIAGYNKYEALGRMAHLWARCRDRKLEDAPADSDGYVVSDAVVTTFLGPDGIKAILAADVDDLALGERHGTSHIYLRGTSETVAALRQRLAAASAGGKARSAAPRLNGRYPRTSRDGAENQPTGWSQPAETVPNSSLIRPPTSVDTHTLERHPDAGRVADRWWTYAATKHGELRSSGIDPTAPPWPITHSGSSKGWSELLDRACELLADMPLPAAEERGKHRVDVSAAEARSKATLRWFNAISMFNAESFERGCAMSVDSAGKRPHRDGGGAPRDRQRDEIRTTTKPL